MTHHKKKKFNVKHFFKDLGGGLKQVEGVIKTVEAPILNQQNQIAKLGGKVVDGVGKLGNNMILPIVIIGGVVLFTMIKK